MINKMGFNETLNMEQSTMQCESGLVKYTRHAQNQLTLNQVQHLARLYYPDLYWHEHLVYWTIHHCKYHCKSLYRSVNGIIRGILLVSIDFTLMSLMFNKFEETKLWQLRTMKSWSTTSAARFVTSKFHYILIAWINQFTNGRILKIWSLWTRTDINSGFVTKKKYK